MLTRRMFVQAACAAIGGTLIPGISEDVMGTSLDPKNLTLQLITENGVVSVPLKLTIEGLKFTMETGLLKQNIHGIIDAVVTDGVNKLFMFNRQFRMMSVGDAITVEGSIR